MNLIYNSPLPHAKPKVSRHEPLPFRSVDAALYATHVARTPTALQADRMREFDRVARVRLRKAQSDRRRALQAVLQDIHSTALRHHAPDLSSSSDSCAKRQHSEEKSLLISLSNDALDLGCLPKDRTYRLAEEPFDMPRHHAFPQEAARRDVSEKVLRCSFRYLRPT